MTTQRQDAATTGPATDPADDYDALIQRLAGAEAEHERKRAAVRDWYDRQVAAARAEVDRHAARVSDAEAALTKAQAALDFTVTEAARLWQVLGGRMRLTDPTALGPPPGRQDGGEEPVTEHPARLLDGVRELLDQVRPLPRRRTPAVLLFIILVLLAVGAGVYLRTR